MADPSSVPHLLTLAYLAEASLGVNIGYLEAKSRQSLLKLQNIIKERRKKDSASALKPCEKGKNGCYECSNDHLEKIFEHHEKNDIQKFKKILENVQSSWKELRHVWKFSPQKHYVSFNSNALVQYLLLSRKEEGAIKLSTAFTIVALFSMTAHDSCPYFAFMIEGYARTLYIALSIGLSASLLLTLFLWRQLSVLLTEYNCVSIVLERAISLKAGNKANDMVDEDLKTPLPPLTTASPSAPKPSGT